MKITCSCGKEQEISWAIHGAGLTNAVINFECMKCKRPYDIIIPLGKEGKPKVKKTEVDYVG